MDIKNELFSSYGTTHFFISIFSLDIDTAQVSKFFSALIDHLFDPPFVK